MILHCEWKWAIEAALEQKSDVSKKLVFEIARQHPNEFDSEIVSQLIGKGLELTEESLNNYIEANETEIRSRFAKWRS